MFLKSVFLFVKNVTSQFVCRVSVMYLAKMAPTLTRLIFRYLINNEQLIQKIADSYPVRRAAQLTAFFIHKGKEIGEDKLEKFKESDIVNRLQNEAKHSADSMQEKANRSVQKADNFMSTFIKNLNEEWKKAEEKLRLEQEKKDKK